MVEKNSAKRKPLTADFNKFGFSKGKVRGVYIERTIGIERDITFRAKIYLPQLFSLFH